MKTLFCVTLFWSLFFLATAKTAPAEEEYSFVMTLEGPQVCLGRWIPPTAVGASGVCEGQMITLPQLTAISARQSVERLDKMIVALSSIEQKMDVNNGLLGQLIDETVKSRSSTEQQGKEVSEFLRETITQRFDALPKGLLVNRYVMQELTRLKEDLLKDVDMHYATQQTPRIPQTPPAQ